MVKKQSISDFSEELVQTISYLHRFSQARLKKKSDALFKGEVTFPQYIVLEMLTKDKALKMKDVAKALHVSLPATTKLIDRLVRLKLVLRIYDKTDRRVVYVGLTDQGKKVAIRSKESRRKLIEQIFSNLTERERRTYLGILRKVKANLYEKSKKI